MAEKLSKAHFIALCKCKAAEYQTQSLTADQRIYDTIAAFREPISDKVYLTLARLEYIQWRNGWRTTPKGDEALQAGLAQQT